MPNTTLTHPTLGTLTFIRMSPPPTLPQQMGLLEVRPGVQGYGAWREASRGVPWQAETFVDCTNVNAGLIILEQYAQTVWSGLCSLNYEGVRTYPNILVLSVMPKESPKKIVSQIGGLNPANRAIVRAVWNFLM